jgi:CheY-like chemotaxis protein
MLRSEKLHENFQENSFVVDDDEVNQMVISAFLEGAGYSIEQVYSGKECLEYLNRAFLSETESCNPPDIVLLDVVMPGMNGFEVFRQMRRRYPSSLPAIMISARSMAKADVIHDLQYASANDYLTKPSERSILLGKLK